MNRTIRDGLAVLRRDKAMTNWHAFCSAVGRPDLADKTRGKLLAHFPVFAELRSIVMREFDRRLEAAEPAEEIALAGGATARVVRRDRSRPAPLTHFLHSGENYGDGRARYFERRPTKGWRWSVADDAEARAWQKQGVRMLADLPQDEIRKRSVA